jgi:hypothetical protein
MLDSRSRFDFIRQRPRRLHYDQPNRELQPRHLGVGPSTNTTRVAMFEDYRRRAV